MEEAIDRPVKVSYIDEMNAFQEQAAGLGLSAAERVLWFALMHLDNRTHWAVWFNVPVGLLSRYTGLSPATIRRTRKSLVDHGLLRVKTRNGSQATLYQLALHDEQIPSELPNHDERQAAHSEREPNHSERVTPSLPAHDERQGNHGERVDNHSERQANHDERQAAHSERIHRQDKTLLRHRHSALSKNEPESDEGDHSQLPNLEDEVQDICVKLGLGFRIANSLTEWAKMFAQMGKPKRGYPLENAIARLRATANGNNSLMEAMVLNSLNNGWVNFYLPDNRKTGQQPKMTEAERQAAYEAEAKKGGWD